MEIDRDKALADVVKTIEEEYIALERKADQLALNQPVIVAVSSTGSNLEPSTQDWNDQVGYSSFNVVLPTPALKVKSIQLLSANIPQANTNIPNTATTFWYYRLNGYSGQSPNADNLFCVRLLPSYYKQELLNTPTLYGYNQTFKNYQALNTALALSCSNDPAFDNYEFYTGSIPYDIPFLPNEISFAYNTTTNRFSMSGTNATTDYAYREYSFFATYSAVDVVYFEGNTYRSLQNDNTGNALDDTAFWKPVYLPIVKGWTSTTIYNKGAIVEFEGQIYTAGIRNTNQSPSLVYTWNNTYVYCRFQVVLYEGIYYTYILNEAGNATPTNTDFWWLSEYDIDRTYPIGFIVYLDGTFYEALTENYLVFPVDGANWREFGDFWGVGTQPISNRYLITGSADPNVSLRQGTAQRQWNPYNLYENAEGVYHNGVKYSARVQNQNAVPFSITNFTTFSTTTQYEIGDIVLHAGRYYIATSRPPLGEYPSLLSSYWCFRQWNETNSANVPIVGLSTISQKFDFYDRELDATFPIGIPPQPYNPEPKRLLNSILGFTFTGKLNAPIFSEIDEGVVNELVPNSLLNQYNRLRPIPTYFIEPVLLGDHPSYNTQTYTADGFCNLVYSSVLRIYCNVIFAGTLDNNLLGIIPLNCGNLGVAFANNYIDTRITKIQDEIYEINIQLEDEFGEPYVLTNNAVSTLMLKLTYKEKPQ